MNFEYRPFANATNIFMFNVCFRHKEKLFYPRLSVCVPNRASDGTPDQAILAKQYKGTGGNHVKTEVSNVTLLTKKQYIVIDVTTVHDKAHHKCFILIDQVRKEIIYFDPMNTGRVVIDQTRFLNDNQKYEDIAIKTIRNNISQFARMGDDVDYEYKVKSLSYTMIECQLFIEGSRMVNDTRKNEFDNRSHYGYCVPMCFYILDAILSYRDTTQPPPPICLDHFIKHFICNAQLIGIHPLIIDPVVYIQFLSGHTLLMENEDIFEHAFAISQNPVERINISHLTRNKNMYLTFTEDTNVYIREVIEKSIKRDFDLACQTSPIPWERFQLYCKHVMVDFRDERCKERPNKIYGNMEGHNSYFGWIYGDYKNEQNNLLDDFYSIISGQGCITRAPSNPM